MCGIAGYIFKERTAGGRAVINGLLGSIRQRGPDDEGICLIDRARREQRVFVTDQTRIAVARGAEHLSDPLPAHDAAFVHTRYAIIDPSPGGHQPFMSRDGSCIAVFNGEIYNYLELKEELSSHGVNVLTASDTEVLVEGWRFWGHDLWPKMNGFWAVAIYDRRDNVIILSRDRLGVAPLYYRQTPQGFYFASLIAPLLRVAPGGEELDQDIVRGYIDTGLKDHDNTTCYRSIFSLPPATTVMFRPGVTAMLGADVLQYWELPAAPLTEKDISFPEAQKRLREILIDAVRIRLRADVPIAFELSGGLDSSSVVAAAAAQINGKLTAYTVKVRGRDEEPYARAVAQRYNIDHRVLTGIEDSFAHDCEDFSRIMEEPYDTPANYLHHVMLRRIKADGFHVILTGAGGDESLAGYEASFWPCAWREWRQQGLGNYWRADWYEFCRRFRTVQHTRETLGDYVRALQRGLGTMDLAKTSTESSKARDYVQAYGRAGFHQQRLYHCRVGLLPYYLRSTDHYTMNIPLEHRFPLLDYRLVEFGLRLPIPYLFQGGWTKFVLRQAMSRDLPGKVVWRRKKMGFPFAFESYFPSRSKEFEKYLQVLQTAGFRKPGEKSYSALAADEPARLWRLLSVGIWLGGRS